MRSPLRAAALLAAGALLLSACVPDKTQVSPTDGVSDTGEPTASATPSDGGEAAGVYGQQIDWSTCGELECATIQVPLDWDEPDGDTVDLAINRYPAADQDSRIGSLLINPGGPGGSGLDFTESFVTTAGDDLLDSYDVVGFDPRGVGESTPVECGSDATIDDYYMADVVIESQDDVDAEVARTQDFAAGCEDATGDFLTEVDTVSAARDMDLLRSLLGDEELYYMGFSYGTQLGATYAELYPENVGRMVLDGALDLTLSDEDLTLGQAGGFENAYRNYLTWCIAQGDCPLGDTVEEGLEETTALLDRALEEPFYTAQTYDLNRNLLLYGIIVTLYSEESWGFLTQGFEELEQQSTGAIMYQLANFYFDREPSSDSYSANSTWAFTAINCADSVDREATTYADIEDFTAEAEEVSPTFGWWFASGTGCDGWPESDAQTVTSLDEAAAGAADKIVVVGTTNDPATPYAWAEAMADQLGAPLLTYEGEGHTAYGRSNACIVDNVDGFMVDGNLPDSGTRC
ncbi:alpha/beta hydrolase [Demequina sp. NBRC 110057]|uniref:alpha/beta hydrolase n=1 Tax=Demequina sp. NBRC 110057 TaxID=1570346 RepID=UPI001F24C312|nr:alpha/beta hydrolase [Demequina sp. NBRC 110057]